MEEYDKTLKAAIEPFEQAYNITKDPEIQTSIAEYIKNACFRFRSDPDYLAKYEKYNAIVSAGK